MLESLITSKTRIKLLLKFFLNPEATSYLRELAEEFHESTNAVRVELNRLTEAGLLTTVNNGRTKVYKANSAHPLFPDLKSMVRKMMGLDHIAEAILSWLGSVELALITGPYASGRDSGLIDLVLVGQVDHAVLHDLVTKAETLIKRKIRTLVLTPDEFDHLKDELASDRALVVWGGKYREK